MLQFECPNCKTRMQAAEEFAGKTTACPECSTPTTIPDAPASASPAGITATPPVPTPAGAVTASEKPHPGAAADDATDEDRPRRRRSAPSNDVGKAAAAGMSVGLIVAIVVGLVACVGISVVAILIALLVPAVQKVREAANRTTTSNNMREIGMAIHFHHDRFRQFPGPKMERGQLGGPQNSVDLSWRVTILPEMGQQGVFNLVDQNVGWDQGNNTMLTNTMPPQYHCIFGTENPRNQTPFQYFTGPNTLFPDGARGVKIAQITDGTSNTFMVAQAKTAVPWSKPADMAVTPNGPLPLPADRFLALFADGSVRHVDRSRNPEAILRLLIDPRDNQPAQLSD